MKRVLLSILALPVLLTIGGCEPIETEEEKIRREYREDIQEERAEWERAGTESLALAGKLREEMTYEEVVEIFGAEGTLRMAATVTSGERKIYVWNLDGGVRAELTFYDDALAEWTVK